MSCRDLLSPDGTAAPRGGDPQEPLRSDLEGLPGWWVQSRAAHGYWGGQKGRNVPKVTEQLSWGSD